MSRPGSAVAAVIEPVVVAAGYDLEDLSVTTAGRRRLVRVMIDRDGGVTLDDAAAISRAISEALDDNDPMGAGAYVLEVTSPGVDRPLTLPRHWRRNIGRLVTATQAEGPVTGRIVATTDFSVTLDVEGQTNTLDLASISKAVVQVELNRKDVEPDPDDADDSKSDRDN
jgi:ribosome maturation factor RimP